MNSSPLVPLRASIAAQTDKGRVRTLNEDVFMCSLNLGKKQWVSSLDRPYFFQEILVDDDGIVFQVSDGLGGMNAGEVAARLTSKKIQEIFTRLIEGSPLFYSIPEFLENAAKQIHEYILDEAKASTSKQGMSTTLLLSWFKDGKLHTIWAGDSRLYLYRKDEGLKPITEDHSVVSRWVRQGLLHPEEARNHPQRHIITSSLGIPESLLIEYVCTDVKSGDIFIWCTDGLTSMLRDHEILQFLKKNSGISLTVRELIFKANEFGGQDNTTLILAQFY